MDIHILAFLLLGLTTILTSSYLHFRHFYHHIDEQIQKKFQGWKLQFSFEFQEQQDMYRLLIFALNLGRIDSHNSVQQRTFNLGINQFSHLTQNQFIEIVFGYKVKNQIALRHHSLSNQIDPSYINLTRLTDIDWQTLGKVSEVKNQGNCNAGYAFSTTSLIETSLMMENQNILLSEQQILDCALNYGTMGCQGGARQGAIKYAQQKGLVTQKQYPYTGTKGSCKVQKGTFFPDFTMVLVAGCDQIKQSLYKSPVTVGVNAKNWQLYSNGVFNNCPTTSEVNHETLLVGVTVNYWRLKNSWGTRWGQSGYIRVKLGNNCGICERPGYGFVL